MTRPLNDGDRPSRLTLGRQLSGELPREEGPALAAFERQIEAARAETPAFDYEILRAASERLADAPPNRAPSPRRRWALLLIPALAAMLALVSIQTPDPVNRIKGESADLGFYVLRDAEVLPGEEGAPLRAGDRVQFTYRADGLSNLVLLSVDGEGVLTVFYPESGEQPEAIIPGNRQVLGGSVELDDALGTESFVAIFDADSVREAVALVEGTWASGGHPAVLELRALRPDVDVVQIEKVQ